jgi:hypothetical protein
VISYISPDLNAVGQVTIEKENAMSQNVKVVYTAKAHTTGGRENDVSRSSDGGLDVRLSTPRTQKPRAATSTLRSTWSEPDLT